MRKYLVLLHRYFKLTVSGYQGTVSLRLCEENGFSVPKVNTDLICRPFLAKTQDTTQLFENIVERAKTIDPVNVRKWFDDLVADEFDGGVLYIGCPDAATAQYLQDHCLVPFTQAAQNITGHLVNVQFRARNTGTALIPAMVQSGVKLHPDYTFDSFVVGPCNRLAHASCVDRKSVV